MRSSFAFILSACLAATVAARVVVEPRASIPVGWEKQEAVPSDIPLKLIFAIKQRNLPGLEATLLAVSDPTSAEYGKHLSLEEVNALVAPSAETVEKVVTWISEVAPAAEYELFSDFVVAVAPAGQASTMLGCTFHRFVHSDSKRTLSRCDRPYTLPEEVAAAVDFVGGVAHFPQQPARVLPRARPTAGLVTDPRTVRTRYHVYETRANNTLNKQAVAQFLGQYYSPLDLQEFFLTFYYPNLGNHVDQVVGPNRPYEAGTEASLDIEYIMSVGAGVKTWFYSTPGTHENQEPFLEWALLLANTSDADIPKVISVSYGDDEDSLDPSYAQRVSDELGKLGTRGVSVLFASGDSGVGCNNAGTKFVPGFPATSPWVTAVGGTVPGLFETGPESADSISSGGFSTLFPTAPYQVDAINQYFKVAKDLPAPSFYNRSGRAFPDIAAMSEGYSVVVDLIPVPGVGGTSCSTPVTSGIISLLNDLRLNANKSTLGFLNPLLYQTLANNPTAFFDVTEGCNPGMGCKNDGFCAAVGWDPATGVGTPLYDKLASIVLALP